HHRGRDVSQCFGAPGAVDRRRPGAQTRLDHDPHEAAAHGRRHRGARGLSPEPAMTHAAVHAQPAAPPAPRGWTSWLTTTDHKRIGLLYFWTAFAFFLVGGVEALLIRLQLAQPNGHVVSAETYNQLFTMHGTTMVFLALMPLSASFFNYIVPLQIGARDVAFPRLNAFSYWVFLLGGLFLNASWLVGPLFHAGRWNVAPDAGWFLRQPHRAAVLARAEHRLLGPRPPDPRHLVPRRGVQLHRHHPEPARAGPEDDAPPHLLVDDAGHPVLDHHGVPRDHGGARVPDVRPLLRHALLPAAGGGHPDPVAAPLLAVRAPGGVHPHPSRDGHRLRGAAHVRPQAALRLRRRRVFGDLDRVHGVGRVEPPHVLRGARAGGGLGVRRHHHAHRGAHGREDLQLDRDAVGRRHSAHRRAAFRRRLHRDVHHRRPLGRLARLAPRRPPADRHLLRGGAYPLRAVRRHDPGAVRGDLLLVAQDDGPAARRTPGQVALLAAVRRPEPRVLPDAFHRALGHAAPHLHLRAGAGGEHPEPGVHRRGVPDRRGAPRVPRERGADTALGGARPERSVGR